MTWIFGNTKVKVRLQDRISMGRKLYSYWTFDPEHFLQMTRVNEHQLNDQQAYLFVIEQHPQCQSFPLTA
jgi:hypothetical protein